MSTSPVTLTPPFRRLSPPLAGTDDRKRTIIRREQRRRDRLERSHEGIVRLPVFRADAVDLKLIDPEQAPELLIDTEIQSEARMAGENVPTIAVRVQHEARALAQIGKASVTDGVDVDHCSVAARVSDQVVVADHRLGIGVRDAERVHHLLAGLLLAIEDDRHDRLHPVRQAASRPDSSAFRRP